MICTIIIPPSSIILNAIIMGEIMNSNEIIGLVVVVFGLMIIDGRKLGIKFR